MKIGNNGAIGLYSSLRDQIYWTLFALGLFCGICGWYFILEAQYNAAVFGQKDVLEIELFITIMTVSYLVFARLKLNKLLANGYIVNVRRFSPVMAILISVLSQAMGATITATIWELEPKWFNGAFIVKETIVLVAIIALIATLLMILRTFRTANVFDECLDAKVEETNKARS